MASSMTPWTKETGVKTTAVVLKRAFHYIYNNYLIYQNIEFKQRTIMKIEKYTNLIYNKYSYINHIIINNEIVPKPFAETQ